MVLLRTDQMFFGETKKGFFNCIAVKKKLYFKSAIQYLKVLIKIIKYFKKVKKHFIL